jgi:hypothetical protein
MQNVESLEPKKQPANERQEGVTEKERDMENKPLQEAKELFREHREEAEKAIQQVVDAKNAFEQKYTDTVRPDFRDSAEFAQLFKDPTIQKAMEMHNKGDERVKSYVYRELCEMLDKATQGKPEQYLLRRMFFRLTPNEVRDNTGRITRNPEQFQAALKERGLATLGTENIHDFSAFIEEYGKQLSTAIEKGIKNGKIEEWITNGSEPLSIEWARRLLRDSFRDNPAIETLRELYARAKYEERGNGAQTIMLQKLHDMVGHIPLPSDRKNPLLRPNDIVADAILEKPMTER